jgi:hypothetical protein
MFQDNDLPGTNYPPTDIEAGATFQAPGPVSRAVTDYLAMCAPRARRGSLVLRNASRSELATTGLFN